MTIVKKLEALKGADEKLDKALIEAIEYINYLENRVEEVGSDRGTYFRLYERACQRMTKMNEVIALSKKVIIGSNCECWAGCEICENWPTSESAIQAIEGLYK